MFEEMFFSKALRESMPSIDGALSARYGPVLRVPNPRSLGIHEC